MTADLAGRLGRLVADAFEACPPSPSIAVAVACDRRGFRWQAGTCRGEPLTSEAAEIPFRIASITKPFVACSIHRLALEGRLSVAQPIAGMLRPETVETLAKGGHDAHSIRISHLLAHTSGIPDHSQTAGYMAVVERDPQRRWQRLEQVALAALEAAPLGAPGDVYAYSDTGYVLLGEILEQATGAPLAAAVRRLLDFGQLGLKSSWWELMETPPPGLPAPARVRVGEIDGMAVDPSFDVYGGGGLISTVGDLNRFFRALVGGGILPAEALAGALATPAARRAAGMPDWRTHSFLLASMAAGRHWALGHTGFWGSAAVRLPALGASIAITLNSGDPAGPATARALLGSIVDTLEDGSTG